MSSCKLPKILSFSGRKHSGKTELAKVCIKYNYELINFADSLKELICNSLGITREYLEEYKDTIMDIKYDLSSKITYISDKINIEKSIVSTYLSEPFDSIRKILQIIGTNLIRNHNHLWHINQIKQKILSNPNKYYCIGDTRFLNEQKMVEDLSGECWFIIRPNMFEISNHYSEIDLKWTDFGNNIIINNVNKELLTRKWQNYLESLKYDTLSTNVLNKGCSSKRELRNILINLLKDYSVDEISLNLNCSSDEIIEWCNNLMIQINRSQYNYNINAFLEATPESSYVMGLLSTNGCIKLHNNNSSLILYNTDKYIVQMYKKVLRSDKPICVDEKQVYSFECDNPFIIENIKLWNLKPQKLLQESMNEEIPFLLENNIEMLKYWIIGLIDGNGSIKLHNNTLTISILASKKIIEHLISILPDNKMYEMYEKCNNLYELNFLDHNCIYLCKWLGDFLDLGLGLEHKWNKISEYILLNPMILFNLLIN